MSSGSRSNLGGSAPETNEFRAYLAADWEQWLREYPELATAFGFPGLNDRWTDDSPSGIEARRAHLAQSLAKIHGIDAAPLDSADRVNYALYRELLETATAGLRFGDDPLPFRLGMPHNLWTPMNQMEGWHLGAPEVLELQPRSKVADLEDIMARLDALPAAIEQNLALLETGRSKGRTPPRIAIRGVPDQVRGLIPADPMASSLLRPFLDLPARLGDAERTRLTAAARAVYVDRIVPSVERALEYLTSRYLPECRETIAASALPDGAAAYAHYVRLQTTTEMTPREIHDLGLAEVRRLRGAMEALMKSTGFSGGFHEFSEFLRTDARFFFGKEDDLVDGYRVIAKKIDPELARLFGRLPRLPYGVRPVPSFRAASSPTAYYIGGATSTGRPGFFYANTYDLRSRPRWEMEALALHESVPGHHLQIALAEELSDLPEFRRYTGYTAFIEGWGLYAESLGDELGLYRDPYSRMGQLTYDMWRSIRLVVDTGMHALGWSRDEAIRCFRENSGKSDLDIAVEVDRYIVWPGQALAYKVGQLKFRELRTRAEGRLGERFDVRAFHDLLLAEGALPLGQVEARVDAWIGEPEGAGPAPKAG